MVTSDVSMLRDRRASLLSLGPALLTLDASGGNQTTIAVLAESMPLLLSDAVTLALPPGEYSLESPALTPRDLAAVPSFRVDCTASPDAVVDCPLSPPGGLSDAAVTLTFSANSGVELDVQLEFGARPLRVVTSTLPVTSNVQVTPW